MTRLLLITLLCISSNALHAQKTILGSWISIDDNTGQARSQVEIYRNAQGAVEGRITELLSTREDKLCDKCPKDDPRHQQPVRGMVIIQEMQPAPDNQSARGGRILDPESGSEYGCILTLAENGQRLKVRGFLGFKALGRTQVWKRNN